jgi:ATP-binding cassette subfamily B protein
MLTSLAGMGRQLLTLLSMISAIVLFSPWLLVLLVAGAIPMFLTETKFALRTYSLLFRQTPQRRELDYIRYLGTSSQSAKEVKTFGLGEYLIQRLNTLFERFYAENKELAVGHTMQGISISLFSTVAYYTAYVFIVLRAVAGTITIGDLGLTGGAFSRASDILEDVAERLAELSGQSLFVKDLFDYLETSPKIVSRAGAVAAPRPIRSGYEFDNVSFTYPGCERKVLNGVTLRFCPGERIALVGENGAGKTTLVKLLSRLYEPTHGRILLDGIDLREYKVDDLRREIGVIFQDYMRYDMLVSENIGFGRIEELTNQSLLESAAAKSLAATMVASFPNGYLQMLGRRFEGGINLSTGQWQRLALARAYMRDAQIVVLDEPTASFDARAEAEVYERFLELTRDRMAVLISHRFSTVRMADRILVLESGRISEEGSHQQLISLGGKYAELFDLQAAAYR